MSDDKWNPFKQAFRTKVSDNKLNARDTSVQTALVTVDRAVARILTAGLADSSNLAQQRTVIENSRAQVMQNGGTTNTQKFDALAQIESQAMNLGSAAKEEADQRIQELQDAITEARNAIDQELNRIASIQFPVAKNAVQAVALPVTQARDNAMRQGTEEARRIALEQIDLVPLQQELDAAKKVAADKVVIDNVLQDVGTNTVPQLKDGPVKTGFQQELVALRNDAQNLSTITDFGALKTAATKAKQDALDLGTRAGNAKMSEKALQAGIRYAREDIAKVVDAAKLVQHPALVALAPGLVNTVEQGVTTAGLKTTDQEILDALTTIKDGNDVATLKTMVAEAKKFDSGVLAMLAGVEKIIATLPRGTERGSITTDYNKIKQKTNQLAREGDLAKAKQGYLALRPDVVDLMDRAAAAGGESGFETALKARYGVDIRVEQKASDKKRDEKYRKGGGEATQFLDRTYEMFGMVPEDHVGHEKLTQIIYNNVWDQGGLYSGDKNAIVMDNFKSKAKETYELNGEKIPANKFNVTMLHEIGHAVDAKNGIMKDPYNAADGFGGWAKASADAAAAQIAAKAMQGLGNNPSISLNEATAAIRSALTGSKPTMPQNASKGDWAKLQKFFKIAESLTEKKEPWFNVKPDTVTMADGCVYVNGYGADWYSFKKSAYDATRVNNYQWRAPGEWFAEIYAIAWLTKKAPPANVDGSLQQWFPQQG